MRSWLAGWLSWREEFSCRNSGRRRELPIWPSFLIGAAEVPIVFTGCRPGDKLTEELVSKTETMEGTIEARSK